MEPRDEIARAALTGLLACPTMVPGGAEGMAEIAYRIADAMLAEREKPSYADRPKPAPNLPLEPETVLP